MPSVEILSRIQFAFTISFHYIYPPLSIGIATALVYMEWRYLRTGSREWEAICKFWLRVFALTFALGVATGIPLQFSLGTNWARYSHFVGDVFGSALAAEGFFAFLVEAGFLGIMIFGWGRVSRLVHFLSSILVCLGAHFSAYWIVVANSWMHTPAGYKLIESSTGQTVAQVTDFWAVIFNPSAMPHVIHVIIGCWLAGGALVMSVSAYYLLKGQHKGFATQCMKISSVMMAVAAVAQLLAAHELAGIIARENPEKMAAFEGVYRTEESTPLYVAGIVDHENRQVTGLAIPGALSFLIHGDFTTPVVGLEDFPEEEWPWVSPVFQMYHLMVSCWGLIALSAGIGLYITWRRRWTKHPWLLRLLVLSVLWPQIGNLSGWYAACMGRQPWVVYKLLKTKDAFSATVTQTENVASLSMFLVVYSLFFVLFLWLLDGKIKHGPALAEEHLTYRNPYQEK